MPTLGENLRRLRKEQRLSQKALAKAAGISQSTLSAIECNQQNPSVYTIYELSNALQCRFTALMSENSVDYDPNAIPPELLLLLGRLDDFELQRVQDFAAGLIAARKP